MTNLRRATSADRTLIESLLRSCGLPLPGDAAESAFFVAEGEARAIAGCAGLERYGDYGLLRSVAVAADARGAGLGARLTAAIIDEARRRRLRALYALTTTAEGYFPRLGFEVIGREEVAPAVRQSDEFTTLCPSTAVVLRLELDAVGSPAAPGA